VFECPSPDRVLSPDFSWFEAFSKSNWQIMKNPGSMRGLFITFEGTEGSGKSTQIERLATALRQVGHRVRVTREPGGTPIGEEIRHTLKHSPHNHGMTPETELLLMNASRAQLVSEVIRPALEAGETVVADRFYDSTLVYQGYGRGLDPSLVRRIIDFAVGNIRPDLTLLLRIPLELSERRRALRTLAETAAPASGPVNPTPVRDRFEEADASFFRRVEAGYAELAGAEPERIREIDATQPVEVVFAEIWQVVQQRMANRAATSSP
jgi:dTMP kinase